MNVYPFELVILLLKAARENQKLTLISNAAAHTIAVINALDVGFNKGKGKILDTWTKSMAGDMLPAEEKAKQVISDSTMAFFEGLPMERRKRKK